MREGKALLLEPVGRPAHFLASTHSTVPAVSPEPRGWGRGLDAFGKVLAMFCPAFLIKIHISIIFGTVISTGARTKERPPPFCLCGALGEPKLAGRAGGLILLPLNNH